MGQFLKLENIATNEDGDGSATLKGYGVLANIDIVPKVEATIDITIARILPDGTEMEIWADSVSEPTPLGRSDFNPSSIELAGEIKVTLAMIGEHANACHVYFTVV